MTQNKGSKIALAVAGLLLVAGAAAAIAMTQSKTDNPLTIFEPEKTSTTQTGDVTIPKDPEAETGLLPTAENSPAVDNGIPGMKNLGGETVTDNPLQLFKQNDAEASDVMPKEPAKTQ